MKAMMTALAAGVAILAMPAGAAEITRLGNTPEANILKGVIVPAGTDLFILSGQLASPIDPSKPATTVADFGDTKTQTISTFAKIKALLEENGYKMSDVIKLTLFVVAAPGSDRMDFKGLNEGYRQFFGTPENPNKPARSALQVAGLAGPNFLIEIEAIAAKPAGK